MAFCVQRFVLAELERKMLETELLDYFRFGENLPPLFASPVSSEACFSVNWGHRCFMNHVGDRFHLIFILRAAFIISQSSFQRLLALLDRSVFYNFSEIFGPQG